MSQVNGGGEQPAILVEGLDQIIRGRARAARYRPVGAPRDGARRARAQRSGEDHAVRILTTLLLPDGGRALVEGQDVVRDAAAVRRSIRLAGQSAAIQEELTAGRTWRSSGGSTT